MKHQCETCNYMSSTCRYCKHCSRRTCNSCLKRCHGMVFKQYSSGRIAYICAPPRQQDLFANPFTRPLPDDDDGTITYRAKETKYHDSTEERADDRNTNHL
jgi:hypothetical protein